MSFQAIPSTVVVVVVPVVMIVEIAVAVVVAHQVEQFEIAALATALVDCATLVIANNEFVVAVVDEVTIDVAIHYSRFVLASILEIVVEHPFVIVVVALLSMQVEVGQHTDETRLLVVRHC